MSIGLAKRNDERMAWGLVAPAVLVVGILIAYPTILNFILSFFDVRLDGSRTYVGEQTIKICLQIRLLQLYLDDTDFPFRICSRFHSSGTGNSPSDEP